MRTDTAVRSNRNTWDEGTWTRSMFPTTDPATAESPRASDGSLPPTSFLTTGNGMGASMSGGD